MDLSICKMCFISYRLHILIQMGNNEWRIARQTETIYNYKIYFPIAILSYYTLPLLCAIDNRQCRQTWIQNSFSHEIVYHLCHLPSYTILYNFPPCSNLLLFYIYIYKAEFYRTLLNKMIFPCVHCNRIILYCICIEMRYNVYIVYSYYNVYVHFSFHVLHTKKKSTKCKVLHIHIYPFRMALQYSSTIYDMVDIIFNNIRVLSESIFNFFPSFLLSFARQALWAKSLNFHFVEIMEIFVWQNFGEKSFNWKKDQFLLYTKMLTKS